MSISVDVSRLAESLGRASSRTWYAQVTKADKLSRMLSATAGGVPVSERTVEHDVLAFTI